MSNNAARICCCEQGTCEYLWLMALCGFPECQILVCENNLPADPAIGKVARRSVGGTCYTLLGRWALAELPVWAGDPVLTAFDNAWYTCASGSCCADPFCNVTKCGNLLVATDVCDFAVSPSPSVAAKRAFVRVSGTITYKKWTNAGASLGQKTVSWVILSRKVSTTGSGYISPVVSGSVSGTVTDWLASGSRWNGSASHNLVACGGDNAQACVNLSGYCAGGTPAPPGTEFVGTSFNPGRNVINSNPWEVGSYVSGCPMCVTLTDDDDGSPQGTGYYLVEWEGDAPASFSLTDCNTSDSVNTVDGSGNGEVGDWETVSEPFGNCRFSSHLEVYVGGVKTEETDILLERTVMIDWCDGAGQDPGWCNESLLAMSERLAGTPAVDSVVPPSDPRMEALTQEANTPRGCCGQ